MTKVTIDRTKWLRGRGSLDSYLLDRNGSMCCLGFAAKTLGCSSSEIKDMCYPAGTKKLLIGLTREKRDDESFRYEGSLGYDGFANTEFSKQAAEINDNQSIDDDAREQQLVKLAKANGFEFVFVN